MIGGLELLVHPLSDFIDEIGRNLHVGLVTVSQHGLNLLLHELFDQFVLIRLLNCWLQDGLDGHLHRRLWLLLLH